MTLTAGSPNDSPSATTPDSASVVDETDASAPEKAKTPPPESPADTRWQLATVAIAALLAGAVAVWAIVPRPTSSANSVPPVQPSAASNDLLPLEQSTSGASQSGAPAPTTTKWGRGKAGWATDRSRMITFELDSEHDVPVWTTRVRPVLG